MINNTTITRTLAVAALVFVFALGALAETRAPANIPFDFEFRGQAFAAGRYEVSADQGFTIVSLTDPSGRKHATLSTPMGNPNLPSPSKLVFHFDGATYQLAEVWLRGTGGKKIKTTRRTPAITSHSQFPRMVEITVGD